MDEQHFFKAKWWQNRGTFGWTKTKQDTVLSNLGNLAHQVKPKVTSLGVILDTELSFKPYISKVHLRNIAKVQPFLTQEDTEKLIHAFITSRLDYCNALFTGLQKKHKEIDTELCC